MSFIVFSGIMLPFIGTASGAALCFFIKCKSTRVLENVLSGFAGGVMMAASFFSLIVPAYRILHFKDYAHLRIITGVGLGILFIIFCNKVIDYLNKKRKKTLFGKRFAFILAIIIHNIPEGIATGVAFSAAATFITGMDSGAAFILALSIALQNIPEGAIISMPVFTDGNTRIKAFSMGALSGIIEPVAAFLAFIFSHFATVLLPYLLAFAAGAMIHVTTTELIPCVLRDKGNLRSVLFGVLSFIFGFFIMAYLDLILA